MGSKGFKEEQWPTISGVRSHLEFEAMVVEEFSRSEETNPIFPDFGNSYKPRDKGTREPLKNKAENIAEKALRDRIDEENEKIRQSHLAGHAQGIQETRSEMESKHEAEISRLKNMVEQTLAELKEISRQSEKEAVELALSIAKKIVSATVELKPDYIIEIVRKGVQRLGAATPFQIRISEQDYEFLDVVGFPQDISEGELGIKYVADPLIKEGCIIETDFGIVDLELEQMWSQIKDSIYQAMD